MRINRDPDTAVGADGNPLLPQTDGVLDQVLRAAFSDYGSLPAPAVEVLQSGGYDDASWYPDKPFSRRMHAWLTQTSLCVYREHEDSRSIVAVRILPLPSAMAETLAPIVDDINTGSPSSYTRTRLDVLVTRGMVICRVDGHVLALSWEHDSVIYIAADGSLHEGAWSQNSEYSVIDGIDIGERWPVLHEMHLAGWESYCAISQVEFKSVSYLWVVSPMGAKTFARDMTDTSALQHVEVRNAAIADLLSGDEITSIKTVYASKSGHVGIAGNTIAGDAFFTALSLPFPEFSAAVSEPDRWISSVVSLPGIEDWTGFAMNFTEHRSEWLLCMGEIILSFSIDDPSSWSLAFAAQSETTDLESENDSLEGFGLFDMAQSDGQVLSVCQVNLDTANYDISVFVSRESSKVWQRRYAGIFSDLIMGHGRSPSSPPVYVGISPFPDDGYGPEGVA